MLRSILTVQTKQGYVLFQ